MIASRGIAIYRVLPTHKPATLHHDVGASEPQPPDPNWVADFQATHGRNPNEQDLQDHLLVLRYPGTGPNGT